MSRKKDRIRITLLRSPHGWIKRHRDTLRALGLRRPHQSVVKDATPAVLGMVKTVEFMVDVAAEKG